MAATDSDDPVYSKSTFLTSYMSNHADTLVAYICHHLEQQSKRARGAKVPATQAKDVKEPRMLKITSNDMELQYKDAADGLAIKTVSLAVLVPYRLLDCLLNNLTWPSLHFMQVTIAFDPPLAGYEEVRPRLLQMKLEAENAIGMVSPLPSSASLSAQTV